MKFWMFLLSLLLHATLYSHQVEWIKKYGGESAKNDEGKDVIFRNNLLYTVGFESSYGGSSKDIWLLGLDPDGNEVISEQFGGSSSDIAYSLDSDDSGFYIAGKKGSNAYAVKSDLNGLYQFDLSFGSGYSKTFYDVLKLSDGNILLVGFDFSYKGDDIDPGEEVNVDKDYLVIKMDSNDGSIIWNKTYGDSDNEEIDSVIELSDGTILLAGSDGDSGIVMKMDLQGNIESTFNVPGFDCVKDLIYDNNKLLLLGYKNSESSSFDVKATFTDLNGEVISNFTFGGVGYDFPTSIEKLSSGNYIFSGYTSSFDVSDNAAWLFEFDSSGDEIWSYIYDQEYNDKFNSVIELPDHSLVAVGGSESIETYSDQLVVKFQGDDVVNQPPSVSDILDQTINKGEQFSTINLDDYVSDPDNDDSEIVWSYGGNSNLSITIVDRVAAITYPNNWFGSETITFTAEDPNGLSDSDIVTFTVNNIDQNIVVDNILPSNGGSLSI
ncbi:MAG: hypothetical protein CSA15_02560, partial [Candidatus Delongbacteria bacterium]